MTNIFQNCNTEAEVKKAYRTYAKAHHSDNTHTEESVEYKDITAEYDRLMREFAEKRKAKAEKAAREEARKKAAEEKAAREEARKKAAEEKAKRAAEEKAAREEARKKAAEEKAKRAAEEKARKESAKKAVREWLKPMMEEINAIAEKMVLAGYTIRYRQRDGVVFNFLGKRILEVYATKNGYDLYFMTGYAHIAKHIQLNEGAKWMYNPNYKRTVEYIKGLDLETLNTILNEVAF